MISESKITQRVTPNMALHLSHGKSKRCIRLAEMRSGSDQYRILEGKMSAKEQTLTLGGETECRLGTAKNKQCDSRRAQF